ncbi:MAG TPA: ABC transporter ATP-binding protein [Clostridia bacterium]
MSKLLEINDLYVQYNTDEAVVYALNGINLSIDHGETLGLVGETGAGKTTLAYSIMGLLPKNVGKITRGTILYNDVNILNASVTEMIALRGHRISMIFQDPMTSLNPVIKVGDQIREVLDLHFPKMTSTEKDRRVDELLELVGIPAFRKNEYPHQFSGGMKQRIVIAMALIAEPELFLADEPTTALDVTIQSQILELIRQLKEKFNSAMLLITHDLGVVAETCDKVATIYAGEIIEYGSVKDVYSRKNNHPYTEGLFGCIPDLNTNVNRLTPIHGTMVDPTDLPDGCKFSPRCKYCMDICKKEIPPVYTVGDRQIKCHRYKEGRLE